MKVLRITGLVAAIVLTIVLAVPWLLPRPGIGGAIPDRPFADSQFTEVLGTRLHYRARLVDETRSGPLLVLLHGFGGSSFSWSTTLDALEGWQFDVIAPDLPPFGYSARSGHGADWPDLVLGLADQIAPQRERVLVGHSMGAGVAAAAAARSDGAVGQLLFVSGGPGRRQQRPAAWRWALTIPSVARALEVYAAHRLLDPDRFASMLASAYGRDPSPEELAGYREPLRLPGTYPALIRRLTRGADSGEWQSTPAVAIWGENDHWVPLSVGLRLQEQVPGLALHIIPAAGHNPMETHPAAFQAVLADILAGTLNPGPSAPGSATPHPPGR